MSYIGNSPTTQAFVTDQFSGTGSQTAFTMSVAPAATSAVLVAISGVLQDPSTYSVAGTTLTFSAAPPSGTGNISCRYLGIPASGVATTAYRTVTEFTATSGQTTFTPPSYTVGFINVYRNGARLGTADYTATNGTTVVLAVGAVAGDLVAVESFYVSSVLNAIPNTPRSVSVANMPVGTVLQVVNGYTSVQVTTSSGSMVDTGLSATITPILATSKILVLVSQNGIFRSPVSDSYASVRLLRNGTALFVFGYPVGYVNAALYQHGSVGTEFLDSPATTSAVTYKTQFAAVNGCVVDAQRDNSPLSTITLMEIAA